MSFEVIHISDLFATVVQRMRPTGTILSIVKIGTTNNYTVTSTLPNVVKSGEFSLRANDYVDLLNVSGVLIKSYQVVLVTSNSFVITDASLPIGTTWRSQAPYYEHGHVLEVANTLISKNDDASLKYQKYPLVVLIQDMKEDIGKKTHDYSNPNMTIFIATLTDATYKAEKRKTDNFTPILYPLYKKLLNEIHYSRLFCTFSPKLIEHTKFDRYYWGKEGEFANSKNIFNDWLDAIEISGLILKVKSQNNLIKNQIH